MSTEEEKEKLRKKGYSQEQIDRMEADATELASIILDIYQSKQMSSYDDLKEILDEVNAGLANGEQIKYGERVLKLLEDLGKKVRSKDGALRYLNVSYPQSIPDSFLIGLRYVKKDGSLTEDHFLFRKNMHIKSFYKGTVEQELPEYKSTHKDQLSDEIK